MRMTSGLPCIAKSFSIAEMPPLALVAWILRNMPTSGHLERRHLKTRIFSPLGKGDQLPWFCWQWSHLQRLPSRPGGNRLTGDASFDGSLRMEIHSGEPDTIKDIAWSSECPCDPCESAEWHLSPASGVGPPAHRERAKLCPATILTRLA